MKNSIVFIFVVAIITVATAQAAFKSSSTGKGTAKAAPPAVCIGDPGTNEPCVITDDSEAFGQVADLKAKVAAGTATKADFEALGITISSDVDLDDPDTIAYLNAKVNAIITSGNLTNSKKPADLKSTIDTATTANVALWTIYKTASGASGYPTSGLTTSLLSNAGVSTTILSDTDTTIANLQSNITSSGLTSSLTATDVENWIVDAAGFSSSTTYTQVQTATTNGWSIANFKTASSLGYTTSSADNTLFGQASGSDYTPHCQAEIDDSSASCTDLTKTQFESAKSGSALLATKKTKVTAGTLTLADLTELELTTTALGSNPPQWKIDYLETVLGTGDSVTKSNWQTTITNFSLSAASKWYLYQIASSSDTSGTYATSNATTTLFQNAGVSSSIITDLSVTDSEISSNIRSVSWTTSPTDTQMKDFLTDATGFPASVTYADLSTAKTNGWTTANYQTAVGQSYTNSAADKSLWDDASGSTYTTFCQIDLDDTSQDCMDMTKSAFTTTKSGVTTATGNGWDIDDYADALQVTSSDWTNSAADEDAFTSCQTSTDGAAAPADNCDITKASWNSIISNLVTLTWNSSMPSSYIIASNNGPGKDDSFKGCNSWWRDHVGATKTNGTGMSIEYSIESVPSDFSTLSVNSSNGELSYTVSSQSVASAQNLTVRAKAVKNGITYANITKTVSIQAVAMVNQTGTIWKVVNSGGSSSTSTVQANLRKTNACPSGYSLATSSSERNKARDLGMNAKGGTWASTWSKPSGHSLDYCSGSPSTCNTVGVNNWSHSALVFGKSGSNTCVLYENSNKTSNRSLGPDNGTCAAHSVGTSGWCVVSYICKYTGSATKKKWPD
ncbi:MAG: hypothetical protein ACON4W_02920 [Parvibaculales bacterium]